MEFITFSFQVSKFQKSQIISFPLQELKATLDDWYIGKTIKNQIEEGQKDIKIDINKEKQSALSVIYSIIYNELLMLNGSDLYLVKYIAKEWSVPEWLSNKIQVKIENQEPIFECAVCNVGFKKSENHDNACKFHRGSFIPHGNYMNCCGNEFSQYCRIGYHIPKK